MGYRILYGACIQKKELSEPQSSKKNKGMLIPILLMLILVVALFACQNEQISNSLLPGDSTITKNALSSLAEDVRSGEPVNQAIAAFCREIIDHANNIE